METNLKSVLLLACLGVFMLVVAGNGEFVVKGNEISIQGEFDAGNGGEFHAFIQTDCNVIAPAIAANIPANQSAGLEAIDNDASEKQSKGQLLSIYPNPFTSKATVEYRVEKTGPVSVKIYDMYGRLTSELVIENSLSAGQYQIALSSHTLALHSGIYFLVLESADGINSILTVIADY